MPTLPRGVFEDCVIRFNKPTLVISMTDLGVPLNRSSRNLLVYIARAAIDDWIFLWFIV